MGPTPSPRSPAREIRYRQRVRRPRRPTAGRPVRPRQRALDRLDADPAGPRPLRHLRPAPRAVRGARARDHRGGRGRVAGDRVGGRQGGRPLRVVHGRGGRRGARGHPRWPRTSPPSGRWRRPTTSSRRRAASPGTASMGFVIPFVNTDSRDPSRYLVYLEQAGLGLPDESYYRDDAHEATRTAYVGHVERMLGLAGWDDPAGAAQRVMAHETAIAAGHWDTVTNRDPVRVYNLVDRAGLADLTPGVHWDGFTGGLGGPRRRVRHRRRAPARPPALGRDAARRAARLDVARLARLARRAQPRPLPVRRVRRGELRLLRPHPLRRPGDARPLEAGRLPRRGVARRGARAALRRAALPAARQGAHGRARRPPRRGVPAEPGDPAVARRRHPARGARQARGLHAEDRLPRPLAGLLLARDRRPATCSATSAGPSRSRSTASSRSSGARSTATSGS